MESVNWFQILDNAVHISIPSNVFVKDVKKSLLSASPKTVMSKQSKRRTEVKPDLIPNKIGLASHPDGGEGDE